MEALPQISTCVVHSCGAATQFGTFVSLSSVFLHLRHFQKHFEAGICDVCVCIRVCVCVAHFLNFKFQCVVIAYLRLWFESFVLAQSARTYTFAFESFTRFRLLSERARISAFVFRSLVWQSLPRVLRPVISLFSAVMAVIQSMTIASEESASISYRRI